MLAVALGALLAGAFAVLGAVLQATRERNHWLRQEQLKAWSGLLSFATQELSIASRRWDEAKQAGWDQRAWQLEQRSKLVELISQVAVIQLISSDSIFDASEPLATAIEDVMSLLPDKNSPSVLRPEEVETMTDALDAFVTAARKDLQGLRLW